MIYYIPIDAETAAIPVRDLLPLLSKQRKEKVLRYRHHKDQLLSAFAYLALRCALIEEYDILEAPLFSKGLFEKPYLADHPDLFFSLSHCANGILCSLDTAPSGADIEACHPGIRAITDQFLPEPVSESVSLRELTRQWTLREAWGKLHGIGLNYDLRHSDLFASIPSTTDEQVSWIPFRNLWLLSASEEAYAFSIFAAHPLSVTRLTADAVLQILSRY